MQKVIARVSSEYCGQEQFSFEVSDDLTLKDNYHYIWLLKPEHIHMLYCPTCAKFVTTDISVPTPFKMVTIPSDNLHKNNTYYSLRCSAGSGTWDGDWVMSSTDADTTAYTPMYSSTWDTNFTLSKSLKLYKCSECGYEVNSSEHPCVVLDEYTSESVPTYLNIAEDEGYIYFNLHTQQASIVKTPVSHEGINGIAERVTGLNLEIELIRLRWNPKRGLTSLTVLDSNGKITFKLRDILLGFWGSYGNHPTYKRTLLLLMRVMSVEMIEMIANKLHLAISKVLGYAPPTLKTYLGEGAYESMSIRSLSGKSLYKSYNSTVTSAQNYWFTVNANGTTSNYYSQEPDLSSSPKYSSGDGIRYLTTYNRLPNLNPKDTDLFFDNMSFRIPSQSPETSLDKVYKFLDPKILKLSNRDDNPIKSLFKILSIPYSKAFYRLIKDSPLRILRIPHILQYAKDINNLRKVISITDLGEIVPSEWNKVKRREYSDREPFIEMLLNEVGETLTCNKLSAHAMYLDDSCAMYNKILEYRTSHEIDLLDGEELRGNLKDIHDILTYISDKIDNPNKPLRQNYPSENLHLEGDLGEYRIRFADDTHELRDIGRAMKHCVGTTYSEKAFEGKCHIAVLMKGSKYLVCMELSPDMGTVKQAKIYDNQKPEGDVREALDEWIIANHLMVATSDLPPYKNPKECMIDGRLNIPDPRIQLERLQAERQRQEQQRYEHILIG